jgi:hypothetical protein
MEGTLHQRYLRDKLLVRCPGHFDSGVVQADNLRRVGNPPGAPVSNRRAANKLHHNALTKSPGHLDSDGDFGEIRLRGPCTLADAIYEVSAPSVWRSLCGPVDFGELKSQEVDSGNLHRKTDSRAARNSAVQRSRDRQEADRRRNALSKSPGILRTPLRKWQS